MTDTPDASLLEEFAREKSETAFAVLVERHINLVHSVALRHTANPQHAQDITQAVFIILARKATALNRKTVLPGWLYHTARLTAANFQRAESSRVRREQEIFMQSSLQESTPDALWVELSPLLDEAMSRLGARDRDALLLRYFQNKSLSEVGAVLGLEERTAQKRVARAIEKLRKVFAQRGVTLSGAAIAGAVSASSIQAAPAGLAVIISAAPLSGTTITTAAVMAVTKAIAMTTFQKALITAALVATVGTGIFEAHQAAQLREQNKSLAQQIAQLQINNDGLLNRLTEASDSAKLSDKEINELLKLRSEVGLLRQQTNKFGKRLASKADQVKNLQTSEENVSIQEQEKRVAVAKMNDADNYTLGIIMYAHDNQGQIATNFEQIASYLTNSTSVPTGTNSFELVYHGSLDELTDPKSVILIQESQAMQTSSGRWVKT
jgi:RNA polymerase sigma factor (sigma-70 family)